MGGWVYVKDACLIHLSLLLSSCCFDHNSRLGLRLHRNVPKSKSFHDHQKRKAEKEKLEAQLKELQDGGGQDLELTRKMRIRNKMGLKSM